MLQDAYSNRIKIGKSNSYRAMYGSLRSLGYDHDTSTSAYCAASNIINKDKLNKDTVAKHVYHLRYLYELKPVNHGLVDDNNWRLYFNQKDITYNSHVIGLDDTSSLL